MAPYLTCEEILIKNNKDAVTKTSPYTTLHKLTKLPRKMENAEGRAVHTKDTSIRGAEGFETNTRGLAHTGGVTYHFACHGVKLWEATGD